ncbi:hypothetical protein N7510_006912 [Penicillium lagena]|uniref:uncharacterized protein n=1 Tax=Penicillium lagena TaxID=94218 RepID=UPI002540D093|nr:uncharacterized protein N7510_006912 [Penicillium lagena]KAJ5610193.1 hypothetical protein N7510_006912 [Penicillium lagena]
MGEPSKKRRLSGDADAESKMEVDTNDIAEPKTSQKTKRTLFVRSLPASATTESLVEHFSQSYVIKHAIVVSDRETKQSKGYGFVTFADLEDAQSALEELNGSVFDGKKIRVDYAESRHREIDEKIGKSVPTAAALKSKQEREEQRGQGPPPKLIVRNLPWSIKEPDDLAVLFRSFGKVKHATLPKKGDKLAGFGFVILRGKKNAEKALQAVNGKEVDGRALAVDWAVEKEVWEKTKEEDEEEDGEEEKGDADLDMEDAEAASDDVSEDEDSEEDDDEDLDDLEDLDNEDDEEDVEDDRNASTIFLRNLPFTATDDSLYEHFAQFGPLRYARVVLDYETERPRGTGFVCFWKPEDATSCIREAPRNPDTMAAKKDKSNQATKHSVLQNENSDPSGRYTMDGRVLQVARAVSKTEAGKLEEEGVSRRLVRDKDKRRLYLLSEGTIPSDSPLYKKLSPSEIKMREESFKQRQNFIKKNPALHISLTRLAIRNIPRYVTSKDLKQLARQAVVGFATDVKKGIRQSLSKEEQQRSRDTMKELETIRKQKKAGIVRQAKVVFETRDGSKVTEKSGGGRSRGYGFIEYYTHRHALMGLRWLNCHMVEPPAQPAKSTKPTKSGKAAQPAPVEEIKEDKKKRLIVEFAIENAQVVKRRNERELQQKARADSKTDYKQKSKDGDDNNKNQSDNAEGRKRKRGKDEDGKDEHDAEEENKLAKRNRIISRKRMQRKSRKGKA